MQLFSTIGSTGSWDELELVPGSGYLDWLWYQVPVVEYSRSGVETWPAVPVIPPGTLIKMDVLITFQLIFKHRKLAQNDKKSQAIHDVLPSGDPVNLS